VNCKQCHTENDSEREGGYDWAEGRFHEEQGYRKQHTARPDQCVIEQAVVKTIDLQQHDMHPCVSTLQPAHSI